MFKRRILKSDPEQKCRAWRPTRAAIAAKYHDLPTAGLTLKEVARDERRAKARQRWDALSPGEREIKLSRLRPVLGRVSGACPAAACLAFSPARYQSDRDAHDN
jgi:hypothetical protein